MKIGTNYSTSGEKISQLEKLNLHRILKKLALFMTWNEQPLKLMEFKQQLGQCDVTPKYAKNPNLCLFMIHYRSQYRKLKSRKKSTIRDERISQLAKIGFQ